MHIEQHLVGLQQVRTQEEAAVELELRNLQVGTLAINDSPILAPVELERFARSKPEWNERKTKPRSRLLEAVHESASGLHCEGLVTKRRMVEYDALCLEPVSD